MPENNLKRHTILNSFLCCISLERGSIMMIVLHSIICILELWHSVFFGKKCDDEKCLYNVGSIHYFWIVISIFSITVNFSLLCSLFKKSCKLIIVWTLWYCLVSLLRFIIIILLLVFSKSNDQIVSMSVIFHVIVFFLTIYFILVLLSYNQQVTLSDFGCGNRPYPKTELSKKGYSEICGEEKYLEEFV